MPVTDGLEHLFQSTQPEWAATTMTVCSHSVKTISIHAARVGCDGYNNANAAVGNDFNPRSPSGLRQGREYVENARKNDFNPRSPSGLRLLEPYWVCLPMEFQSTQPEWAATFIGQVGFADIIISIHAARVGCDGNAPGYNFAVFIFQSTQPEWAAT